MNWWSREEKAVTCKLHYVQEDRAETNNLAEKCPDKVSRMNKLFNEWTKRAKTRINEDNESIEVSKSITVANIF